MYFAITKLQLFGRLLTGRLFFSGGGFFCRSVVFKNNIIGFENIIVEDVNEWSKKMHNIRFENRKNFISDEFYIRSIEFCKLVLSKNTEELYRFFDKHKSITCHF